MTAFRDNGEAARFVRSLSGDVLEAWALKALDEIDRYKAANVELVADRDAARLELAAERATNKQLTAELSALREKLDDLLMVKP